METDNLRKEFNYYRANQDEMVARYDGKTVAIQDEDVIGVFDSAGEAVRVLDKRYTPGTYLIQRVSEGNEAYTATFHSRVRINP